MADREERDDEALLDECGASPARSTAKGGGADSGPRAHRRMPVWLTNVLVLTVATALILGGVWLTGSWRSKDSSASGSGQGDGRHLIGFEVAHRGDGQQDR